MPQVVDRPRSPRRDAVSAAPGGVLVVNSDPSALERICRLLSAAGFEATPCATAGDALARMREQPRRAMVVDYMLDDMSGFALVQACGTAGHAPATIMTARRAEVSAAVRALREGVADFLAGPVDGRIVQALRSALGTGGG